MKKTTLCARISALLLTLALASTAAADKPVHLFILSGQSNMAGMDPKAGFVPEAAKLLPDAEVVYLKVASGGQPIRLWVSEWNEIAAKHGLDTKIKGSGEGDDGTKFYKPIVTQYKALIAKHPKPASVTFCWMQGERDAKENLSAAYPDAMRQLIANLRRDLDQPAMNFVIGRISDYRKDGDKSWTAVRAAQVAVAEADPHGAWADCDDLNDKEQKGVKRDDLHYTKDGYVLLGQRYARQAKALIDGKKPAANGRPE
jgi:hypothetical protein